MDRQKLPKELITKIKKYASVVKKHYDVDQFILFGSQAKGTANEFSDIDICVLSSQFGKNLFAEKMKLLNYTIEIDHKIEPTPMHPDVYASRYDTLASEIREHGIAISI